MKNDGPSIPIWRKSSYSSLSGGECVEAAQLGPVVGVRDSKDTTYGHLNLSAPSWSALTQSLKD
ncbi:DUF397 domain-containing protein [Streptomycetaceae bacterium NBC_01309]